AMPRPRCAGGVAVAAALAAVGCLSLPKAPTSAGWLDPYNGFGTAAPPGKGLRQTTLIDQPAGDPYLTRELSAAPGKPLPPEPAEGGGGQGAVEPGGQDGAKEGWVRLAGDGAGVAWRDGKPAEAFDELGREVTVGPKDYLVVGPTEVPGGKLGGAFFVCTTDGRARMRVLVVRAWRSAEPAAGPVPGRKAVAAQAGVTVARGQR